MLYYYSLDTHKPSAHIINIYLKIRIRDMYWNKFKRSSIAYNKVSYLSHFNT